MLLKVYLEDRHTAAEGLAFLKGISPKTLKNREYKHLWLLLYWPLYTVAFFAFEWFLPLSFHSVRIPLDDHIPFCEWFIIPYYWWFALLVGISVYTALYNKEVFCRFMYFIMLSYTLALICYAVYPTQQELRPDVYPRDNLLTQMVQSLHNFDSNENVCPSVHVLGAFGSCIAGLQCRRFRSIPWRCLWWVSLITVILSTVFIKQHSLVDVFVALVICGVLYPITFGRKKPFCT